MINPTNLASLIGVIVNGLLDCEDEVELPVSHGLHPPPQLAILRTTIPSISGKSINLPSSSNCKYI